MKKIKNYVVLIACAGCACMQTSQAMFSFWGFVSGKNNVEDLDFEEKKLEEKNVKTVKEKFKGIVTDEALSEQRNKLISVATIIQQQKLFKATLTDETLSEQRNKLISVAKIMQQQKEQKEKEFKQQQEEKQKYNKEVYEKEAVRLNKLACNVYYHNRSPKNKEKNKKIKLLGSQKEEILKFIFTLYSAIKPEAQEILLEDFANSMNKFRGIKTIIVEKSLTDAYKNLKKVDAKLELTRNIIRDDRIKIEYVNSIENILLSYN